MSRTALIFTFFVCCIVLSNALMDKATKSDDGMSSQQKVTKYTILCSMARKKNCKKNAIKAVEFENKCLGGGMNADTCKKLSENILFSGAN